VTIWARVQVMAGEKVVSEVPLVMPKFSVKRIIGQLLSELTDFYLGHLNTNSLVFGHYPFTEPAVTPLMMYLLRNIYTTTTGRMARRMNIYTLPMSNLE